MATIAVASVAGGLALVALFVCVRVELMRRRAARAARAAAEAAQKEDAPRAPVFRRVGVDHARPERA